MENDERNLLPLCADASARIKHCIEPRVPIRINLYPPRLAGLPENCVLGSREIPNSTRPTDVLPACNTMHPKSPGPAFQLFRNTAVLFDACTPTCTQHALKGEADHASGVLRRPLRQLLPSHFFALLHCSHTPLILRYAFGNLKISTTPQVLLGMILFNTFKPIIPVYKATFAIRGF
jgi:hypothetical protein